MLIGSLSPPKARAQAAPTPAQTAAGEPHAEAEPNLGVDPTEPSALAPIVALPVPKSDATHGDDEPVQEAVPGDPWGDTGGDSLLTLRALLQTRYVSTFVRDSTNPRESYQVREEWLAQNGDGWGFSRIFLRIGSDPNKYIGFRTVLDFAELFENDPEDVLKQAYATFRPLPEHLEIAVGMFKLPFSTLELDASSRYELASFGEANGLSNRLGYGGRDIGLQLLATPLKKKKRLRLSVGAFRGHYYDENASPVGTLAGRIEVKPHKSLRIGADGVWHMNAVTYDRPFNTSNSDVVPNPADPAYPTAKRWDDGYAVSGDLRFKRKGLMLRGEGMYGQRIDVDERYGAGTFWAAWGLISYRIDLGSWAKLLPAVRYEWLDSDIEH
ncbi:MAG TPA: hypothetical protein VFZ61_06875, partial [Polyangiales bacterium]